MIDDSQSDSSGELAEASTGDSASAAASPRRRHRGRYARPSLKAKQAAAAKAELDKLQRRQAMEAARARQVEEARSAIEALIAQDIEQKRAEMMARRPATIVDYCKTHGLPLDIHYHPRYNAIGVPPETDEQRLEAICFGRHWPSELGGLGGYDHLANFIKLTWPTIAFNPWLEDCLRSLTSDDNEIIIGQTRLRFLAWTGPGSAGKSFASGLFACAFYMFDWARGGEPRTSVTLTSTSKGIISQRVWPVIQHCFHDAKRITTGGKLKWGHMIDSQKIVMGVRSDGTRDAKNSICALAVESGEVTRAVDNIKGRHTERMLLIVDEANSTPQAIFECIPNMLTSVRELVVLVIGNAVSRLDPHGLCCEPARGWKSITIEDTSWPTKGVAKWGIGPGICLHFDGAKSPNVLAGRTEHKHIYSYERWQHVLRMGEEYRNTLQHWSQDRGFWTPDGMQTTVISEAQVVRYDGAGKHIWVAKPLPCASLDPSHGGDQIVLLRGQLGSLLRNRKGVEILERVIVPFDPESPDDIQAQIAKYVVARCKEWGVEPPLFGTDSTGTGRGVKGFIVQYWSPRILAVEFGGAASDLPASLDDPRNSHEVYANRVTELWYACRDVLVGGQLKGLYNDAIRDLTTRTYSIKARRYCVEAKDEMKKRFGHSPDDGDAVAVMIEVARRNGLVAASVDDRPRALVDAEEAVIDIEAQVLNTDYAQTGSFEAYAAID